MRVLLDTHLAFWWQTGDERLSPEARRLAESADQVFVSSVSLWELTIKAGLGKVHLDLEVFEAQVEAMGFTWLPILNRHIRHLGDMVVFDDHRDPFDRLLVAQAMSEPLVLLTADGKLARYGTTVRAI
jgi:PIN domain nuclease of toxin-antitoxin system